MTYGHIFVYFKYFFFCLLIIPVWFYFRYGNLIPSFQSLQLGAALGLVRLALIVGLISQPLSATNLPEDVVNRQVILSEVIWIQINLQEIRNACSKTGISSTKYIWLRHFAGGFFFTLFFFPEIFTVSSKTSQLSSWWISFHQWIIFTN